MQEWVSIAATFLLGIILTSVIWYLIQQKRLAKIFHKADDEFEDQVYKLASRDLDFTNTIGRLLQITANWTKSERTRLILRTRSNNTITSVLVNGRMMQKQVSFAEVDFAELAQAFGKRDLRRPIFIHDVTESSNLNKILKTYRIDYLVPLSLRQQIVGFMGLSAGKINKYTLAEIWAAHNGIVVALETAQVRDELILMNEDLKLKISSATEDLERANRQLMRLDQAKDDFIAMTSHQLRTPLTSVKGYLSLVLEGDAGDVNPEQRRALSEAYRASENMTHMVGDFLNLSRLQTGRFIFNKRVVDLTDIVRAEVKAMRDVAKVNNVKLSLKIDSKSPTQMKIDSSKVRQAISNLLDNAIYYSKVGGEVAVELSLGDGFLDLAVKDNGIGVPVDEKAGLFRRFYRTSVAKKCRPGGAGIGLYIVKEIIDGHSGAVYYEANQPRGSVFGFRLPIDKKLNPGIYIRQN